MVLSVNALFSLRPLFALDEVGQDHELHQRQRRDLRRLKVMRQNNGLCSVTGENPIFKISRITSSLLK